MLIDINVMQCHCSLMNVTLSKFQVLFNNAILPLSAVSDHWLHSKIRRTAACNSIGRYRSLGRTREGNAQTCTVAPCKAFFCG
jgi:hypothetical protein